MVTVREGLILILLASGLFFAAVAAIGLIRLPDLYTRAHSASKSDTLGAILSLGAVGLAYGPSFSTVKIAFLLLFMFLTNPTAVHAITRAAADQGIEPWTTDSNEDDSL